MQKIKPPPPQPELFKRLLAILDFCYQPTKASQRGMNDTAIARALGVTRQTIVRMRDEPPEWPWWPVVLQAAISHVLPLIRRDKRRVVAKMLRELPEEMAEQIEQACEARDYLIDMLAQGPALSSELLKTANRGNISEARIKRAAKQMGIIKTREGKGKEHQSLWELPRLE